MSDKVRFWKLHIKPQHPEGEGPVKPLDIETQNELAVTYDDISVARVNAKEIAQRENRNVYLLQTVGCVVVQAPRPPPVRYGRM